jgi:virginiamycin B lyase
MRPCTLLAALVLAVLAPAPAVLAQDPAIREWTVPWPTTRPRDPYTLDGHTVWFCGQVGHYLARLDTASGEFTKIDLPDLPGPHNLVVDPQGIVWYAGNLRGYIGRLDPSSGAIEKIPMPDPAAVDPHTLVFDAAGDIWFSVQGGNFVGRLAVATRRVDLVAVPTRLARPYGIVPAPDGTVWVALFGTHKLAAVDPATLALREIALPRDGARPRRVAATADGRVWYVDHAGGYLGAYTPRDGSFAEWPMPGGAGSAPYPIVADDAGRLWTVETGLDPNRLVGFDPREQRFLPPLEIPSGGGSVRHMQIHAPTRTIWFGTDADTIGRFRLPP